MIKQLGLRTVVTLAGALALTGAGIAAAGGAAADPVTVNYTCESPIGRQTGDVAVTITAPATAAVGDTATITVTSGPTPFTTPLDLPAGSVTPSGTVTVGGAQTGSVDVAGPANADPIPAGSQVQLSPMTRPPTLT